MKNKKPTLEELAAYKIKCKGATDELKEVVKEFEGNHEIRFTISKRGNQRIEIEDLDKKEIWQTLECGTPPENEEEAKNFDEISVAMINSLAQQARL